jgi:hypothetical protein
VFRGSLEDSENMHLLYLSGPAPSIDIVRLSDKFVYPDYIDVDYWKTIILDEPLMDIFKVGEPREITGRSADGEPFESLRIFYRNVNSFYFGDRFVTVTVNENRFSLTLSFDDPSDVGEWKLGFLPNGATSSIIGFLQVVE